jgi:hypothetical protein
MAQRKTKNDTTPSSSRAATSSSTIRIETPKPHGRQPKPKVSVIVTQPHVVGGFIDFVREHAVVGLAVGFVIGTQVQTVVK